MTRRSYEGVAVAVPITVPYVRYSIRSAHWWLARCLADLLKQSGLKKDDIDGLSVSSFTLAPDTAIGLTQHLGLSPRWLDHVPFGGASGVVMLRRAARAVQAGDAGVGAWICGGNKQFDFLRPVLPQLNKFAKERGYSYIAGRGNPTYWFVYSHGTLNY